MNCPPILIVTANQFLGTLMGDLLAVNDVTTAHARDRDEALDLVERVDPVLVIIDGDLPGRDTGELIKDVGSSRHVLVAADTRRVDARRLESTPGCAGIVRKPIETGSFARSVTAELRRVVILADT